jgi:predicted enzyme related to lactoylglutathione lyase
MAKNEEAEQPDGNHVDDRLARHGHVSYLEIPASDVERSAAFYEAAFGWNIDRRGAGHCSFDDRSGDLIGRWVTGRAASREAGLVPYIYVNRIDEVVQRIVTGGGEIVKPPYPEGNLWVATFRDPAGNVMGIWEAD